MPLRLPDPRRKAQQEAERLRANPARYLEAPIDRVIADSPQLDRRVLLEGIE